MSDSLLKDNPRHNVPEDNPSSAKLAREGTNRLDAATLSKMNALDSAAALCSTLTLVGGANAARDNNRARSNQELGGVTTHEQPAQKKEKAIGISQTYPNSFTYENAIERWKDNTSLDGRTDGTKTGYTRFNPDNSGKTTELHWTRDQYGKEISDYAVETTRTHDGDRVHNYFGYHRGSSGEPIIDSNINRGQIVIHNDGSGFVHTPKDANGNYQLIRFNSNKDVLSKQEIPADTTVNTAARSDDSIRPGGGKSATQVNTGDESQSPHNNDSIQHARDIGQVPRQDKAIKSEQKIGESTTYSDSYQYTNASEYWNNNSDGTRTGLSRYPENSQGQVIELHWTRDQYGREFPHHAVEITKTPSNGETVHNSFGYHLGPQGERILDKHVNPNRKVISGDGQLIGHKLPEIETRMASDAFATQMTEAYNNMPQHLHEAVKESGYKIVLGHHITQSDIMPELAGVTPRGWPPGSTWDNNDCITDSGKKMIVVAEFKKIGNTLIGSSSPAGALRHEIGHVIDKAWHKDGKNFSDQNSFINAYHADVRNMHTADRDSQLQQAGGHLQEGAAGREETFADVLAFCTGGPRNDDQRAQMARAFPRLIGLVDMELKERARLFAETKYAKRERT